MTQSLGERAIYRRALVDHPVGRHPVETITADTTVNEIMKMYPELTDFLMDLGLCGCGLDSTLTWTVKRVSREKNIELVSLLQEINRKKT